MADRTYTLTFICENCGKSFTKEFPFGKDVKTNWNGCWCEDDADFIRCSNCGSSSISKKWD